MISIPVASRSTEIRIPYKISTASPDRQNTQRIGFAGAAYSKPRLIARSTAWVRSRTPSLTSIEDTWFFTVPSDL